MRSRLRSSELAALMERVEGEAQDMLAFQLAMLEDDALSAPAFAAIESGVGAHTAWADAMDAEIAGYEASEDDYFRARAADLKDMRDRVLRHVTGEADAGRRAGCGAGGRGHRPHRLSRNRLEQGRRHRPVARQHHEPCGDAGAGARHSHGGGARRGELHGRGDADRGWRQRRR